MDAYLAIVLDTSDPSVVHASAHPTRDAAENAANTARSGAIAAALAEGAEQPEWILVPHVKSIAAPGMEASPVPSSATLATAVRDALGDPADAILAKARDRGARATWTRSAADAVAFTKAIRDPLLRELAAERDAAGRRSVLATVAFMDLDNALFDGRLDDAWTRYLTGRRGTTTGELHDDVVLSVALGSWAIDVVAEGGGGTPEVCDDCKRRIDDCGCGAHSCAACSEYPRFCTCRGRTPPTVYVTARCGHRVTAPGTRAGRRAAEDRDCQDCTGAHRAR